MQPNEIKNVIDETPELARSRWQLFTFSRAMNATGRQQYGGTVPAKVVARRRAANKVARASRRHSR